VRLEFIPFIVFMGCCLSQFWWGFRIKSILRARHPEVILKTFSYPNQLVVFVQARKDRKLGDQELSVCTARFQLTQWIALSSVLAMFLLGSSPF